tara:strand:+ start:564 stop:1160 length:597 start_codon:yes stop_codon:yes gene_type:complete
LRQKVNPNKPLKETNKLLLWLFIFVLVAVDQLSKFLTKSNLELGESISILSWFKLFFIENNGFAFGLEIFGKYGKLALTLTRIFFVSFLIFWFSRLIKYKNLNNMLILSFCLVISGAIGNIIDSVFYGYIYGYAPIFYGKVVDMLYFPILETTIPSWIPYLGGNKFSFFKYVFNLADSYITVGAFILFFSYKYIPSKL